MATPIIKRFKFQGHPLSLGQLCVLQNQLLLLLFCHLLAEQKGMMHQARAYQSITPANNMILKRRWDKSRFDLHRMKVRNAKPMIDNKPPQTYMHLHLNLKKLQMEEERRGVVERDNGILLDKMARIMRTKGRVDNVNNYQQRSLNKTRRQRDLLRVTHENQAILKRIQSKEPHYNHMQWLHQWEVNKMYMANISKYPRTWMRESQRGGPLPAAHGHKKTSDRKSSPSARLPSPPSPTRQDSTTLQSKTDNTLPPLN